ncbi:unnamed protein product [Paramecium octaurelia]|uniref:Transmembrane protein n=1 Tax=Paramecium octaurelia TaxID=43137 RepID=A0A8S1TGI0_PAROT|nr:unnamed protein product [Paramecium octaurelia]
MIKNLYWLILIQTIVIILTFNFSTNLQIIDEIKKIINQNETITTQSRNMKICQDDIIPQAKIISEAYNNFFGGKHWGFLLVYPIMLIQKQLNKESDFYIKMAFYFHLIQYPFLAIFTHQISLIIGEYFAQQIIPINICFGIFFLNLCFFLINSQLLGIQIKNKRKPLYILFFLFVINGLYNIITLKHHNWIPYLIFNAYIQIYLIHINSNLFVCNQYNKHKLLIEILFEKISLFNGNQDKDYFYINKEVFLFFGILITLFYNFHQALMQMQVLATVILTIVAFLIFIIWDTSLISSNFTNKSQWLAADLFFLDLFLPFRNIVMFLLIE